jgi:SAM-dependent methyltransferase
MHASRGEVGSLAAPQGSKGMPALTGVAAEAPGCAVCGAPSIDIIDSFAALPRATSDCRPFPPGGRLGICRFCHAVQKPADARWQADAAAIYACYDIFRQAADGAEQRVFDQGSGTSLRRSDMVLQRLQSIYPFAATGRALDVGCGNGPTLRALAALAPGWRLSGHDISDANAARLAAIPSFERLYTGATADIDGPFDLITLFHSLEHLPSPVAGLAALRGKLAPGGLLLVEVPNLDANIYDLVVADHRSHFGPRTLAAAARQAGWPHVVVFDDWAFKELTLLAADKPIATEPPAAAVEPLRRADLQRQVDWLATVVEAATRVAATAATFGLFCTAIAATWLFGPAADRVAFFVDEDPARIGQQHEGRPILAPAEVPAGAAVFIPLVPLIAEHVASRLRAFGIDAQVPPELPI